MSAQQQVPRSSSYVEHQQAVSYLQEKDPCLQTGGEPLYWMLACVIPLRQEEFAVQTMPGLWI